MDEEEIVQKLKELLEKAVEERCEEKTGIIFSGGLDSGIIAFLAKKFSQVTAYCVGIKNSKDLKFVKNLPKEVDFEIKVKAFTLEEVQKILQKILQVIKDTNPIQVSCAIPIYFASKKAQEHNIKVMLTGQGGDELFGGYHRYLKYAEDEGNLKKRLQKNVENIYEENLNRDTKICESNGIELRAPYLDEDFKNFALQVPVNLKIKKTEEFPSCRDEVNSKKFVRKYILRKVGEKVGVSESIVKRPKKALQYGSGSWKILQKIAKKRGFKEKAKKRGRKNYVEMYLKSLNFN